MATETRARLGVSALWGMLGVLLMGIGAPAAAQTFTCNANEVYSISYAPSSSPSIYRVDTNTGGSTYVGALPAISGITWNGMGIQGGGDTIYAVASGDGRVMTYGVDGSSELSQAPNTTGYTNFPGGAVNPANGWFYAISPVTGGSSNAVWGLFAYNTASGAAGTPVLVGRINAAGNNGDLAFDALGNLYLLSGNIGAPTLGARVYRVSGPIPTTAGSGNLPSVALTPTFSPSANNFGGIAFSDGLLVLQVGATSGNSTYYRVDPTTGATVGSSFTSVGGLDLASCQYPNTIRLQKNLPQGRVASGDQFGLSITGGGIASGNTGTTTGSGTGLQTPIVGPVLAQSNTSYTITETGAGGANLSNYVTEWACTHANGTPFANGTGTPATFTMQGSGSQGTNLLCTFTNTAKATIRLQKSLPNGRLLTSDQFLLRIAGGSGADVTTTTTGGTNTPAEVATQGSALAGTTYTLSESAAGTPATVLDNYTTTYACTNTRVGGQTPTGSGTSFTVTAVAGDNLTCTFTNALKPRVTIRKTSVGGVGPFSFTGDNGIAAQTLTTTTAGSPVSGTTQTLTTAGTVTTITEALPAGYTLTAASCTGAPTASVATNLTAGTLTLGTAATVAGANIVCTFTNTRATMLTLIKTVTNDNGGTQAATAWTLSATGPTNISGVTGDAAVTNAVVNPGNYALSESATPTGYVASLYSCVRNGGAAVAGNSIALAAGDSVTCTINNNDSNQTDISITKSASPSTVASGGQVTFTLVVRNLGIAVAHGAVVRDPAVAGLDCTAAGLPAPTCSATGSASCPASLTASGLQAGVAIPTLPNGGVVTIGLTCNVAASGF